MVPEGRKLLKRWKDKCQDTLRAIIMDHAYEGGDTRQLVWDMKPVVPPKANRLNKWEYGRELYKKRNEAEFVSTTERISENLFTV